MRNINLPSINRPIGSQTIVIPPTPERRFTAFGCAISRESIPVGVDYTLPTGEVIPETAFVITMQKSTGGATWESFYIGTFPGGVQLDRAGNPLLFTSPIAYFRTSAGDFVSVIGDTRMIFQRLVAMRCSVDATMFEPGDLTPTVDIAKNGRSARR